MLDSAQLLQIKLIRKYLKLKISEDNITFRGHSHEKKHVYELMKRTIKHGESHSALIIGPRGSGKTTLVNSVLHELSKEMDIESDAHVVRLSGLLHQDEKVALKAITAQIQLENAVGDRVFGTFAENLSFLISCLQSGADRRCKSMLFVLDEFHLFCHTGRTQTLLYNLLDITHSQESPMCVLGVTSRLDVMELLEKRVKSRFSHRHIFLFPNEVSGSEHNADPKNRPKKPYEAYVEILVQLLSLPTDFVPNAHRSGKEKRKRLSEFPTDETHIPKSTQKVKKVNIKNTPRSRRTTLIEKIDELDILGECSDSEVANTFALPAEVLERCKVDVKQFEHLEKAVLVEWNRHVKDLSEEDRVIDAVEKFCYYKVNEQIFRDVLFQLVSRISPTKPLLEAVDLCALIEDAVCPNHRTLHLQSLSILELSLVIAMQHGADILDGQPMNFEMVLHRYRKFAETNSSTQSVPRAVLLKAWEHLQALQLILPVRADNIPGQAVHQYRLFSLAVSSQDVADAVKGFRALPTEIAHWASNSVV